MLSLKQKSLLVSSLAAFSMLSDVEGALGQRIDQLAAIDLSAERVEAANLAPNNWSPLVERLKSDGVSESLLQQVFYSDAIPPFKGAKLSLKVKEPASIYNGFLSAEKVDDAASYLSENEALFDAVESAHGVNRFLIAATLLVESDLGRKTGKDLVVYSLAKRSSAEAAWNVEQNFERLQAEDRTVTKGAVEKRAKRVSAAAYIQLVALLELHNEGRLDVFTLKGSYAGAFGNAQFMPETFKRAYVDGNGNGVISPLEKEDAVFSIANLYDINGWSENASASVKHAAVLKYNNSEAYARCIEQLSNLIHRKYEQNFHSHPRQRGEDGS